MTMDLHALTGAYALDALEDPECRQFEAHLAECEACAEEVRGLRATGAKLAVAAATAIPSSLHDSVMTQVRSTRQLTPLTPPTDDGRVVPMLRRARTTSRALVAVAAALLVLAGSLGAVAVQQQQKASQAQAQADQVAAVLGATDARLLDAGGAARVIMSTSQGKAVFVGQKLPAVDAGYVLQLWVLGDGQPRSVALVRDGSAVVASGVRSGLQLGVTVEPAGGSKQPTTAPVLRLPLS